MANFVVLECHLLLNLTEIRDADKMAFLDSPVSPKGQFGPAMDRFMECFTVAQKISQALCHFLPKCPSSERGLQHRPPDPPMTRKYPFPKQQGPRPHLVQDPEPHTPFPPAGSWC